MLAYGYVKDYRYTGDGTFLVQTRIPAIHGPFRQDDYRGKLPRGYVQDADLPFFPSVILPHTPVEGEVVALMTTNEKSTDFIIVGLTGGSYYTGATNIGG